MANNVGHDQTPSSAYVLGIHCLLKNARYPEYYVNDVDIYG